jgi:hypothetical protein
VNLHQHAKVAVLLATHNGGRFVEQQIESLKQNTSAFTLHWLDDHSTDNTREIVRTTALNSCIEMEEWHRPEHQGVPGAYFQLLECVDADIYLFCDQDDIWQPGKIDEAVANLLPDMKLPTLCFSDPLLFKDSEPNIYHRLSEVSGEKTEVALQESRLFTATVAVGHTQGFTRPLREIFVKHKDIARTHAHMHDAWMYIIAVASGTARILSNAPTTLYRRHGNNVGNALSTWRGTGSGRLALTWRQHQSLRQILSRRAKGFILAAPTLPPGPKLQRLLSIARLVSTLERRQSPVALVRLLHRDIMPPSRRFAIGLAAACLCSDAKA